MSHSELARIAEMSNQAHLSSEEVDDIRHQVSLRKHNIIPKQRTCGYKGINRTTLEDIKHYVKYFRFPKDAIRDVENRLSLQSTIRSIATSVIRWDIDRGNAPTWTNCTHTQKARMLHELEERYPWMKQFHGQWVAVVLMGKHVSSKSRDMHKALKVRCSAMGTSSVISRTTEGFSPVITSEPISSRGASESIDEEEIVQTHEESDAEEHTYRDDVIEQEEEEEEDDDQPLIPSFLSKTSPAGNVDHRAGHSERTCSIPSESSSITAVDKTPNPLMSNKRLKTRVIQNRTLEIAASRITSTRYESKITTINRDIGRKSTELKTSTSVGSNAAYKNRISKERNNHPASSINSNDQLAEEDTSSLQSVKDRGKHAPI